MSNDTIWTEVLDVRTLAEHLSEHLDVMEDGEPSEAEESRRTLAGVQEWIKDTLAEDVPLDEVPDRIRRIASESSPTLVRSDFWPDFARDEAIQTELLSGVPGIIAKSVDWGKVAQEMQKDWSRALMGGHLYSVRNS